MIPGYSLGDIIAVSRLAFKVYTAYKDAPSDYRNISDEVKSLQIIIDKAAKHFQGTTLSDNNQQEGQEILKGCQNILEDLDCLIKKYNSIASARTGQAFRRIKLGVEDIATLRARLTSNTILLNGFIQSCESDKLHARLDNIFGVHRSTSRSSSISFAGSSNTRKAYRKLFKGLSNSGVTAEMIIEKEDEIHDIFNPQHPAASSQMDDNTFVDLNQLPEAGNFFDAETSQISTENPRLRSRFSWVRLPLDFLVGRLMLSAAEAGNTKRLISTLEYVRNINFVDSRKATALHLAAARDHEDIVQLLLFKGASIEATDRAKWTPLHLAAANGHAGVVEVLLGKGASIEAVDNKDWTPLHLAAANGHAGIVEVLLGKGTSVEAIEQDSLTPLHLAAANGHAGIVEVLLGRGASIDAMENDNCTPLHLAAQNGHSGVVEVLLGKGASIKALNKSNQTPLQVAAQNDHTDIVELLDSKATPVSPDRGGNFVCSALAAIVCVVEALVSP